MKFYRVHLFLWYRWYPLKCKPGQNKTDYRGDLEVRVSFTVKAVQNQDHGGSTASIANKNKSAASFEKFALLLVVFLGPIICKIESDLTVYTLVISRPV